MVFSFARFVAPRLAARLHGPGRVAVIGCALNVAGQLYWLTQIQAQSAYLTHLLAPQLIGGAGVGLTIPSLIGAGSTSLPPARFGTGSGILNMARQIGTVLGVASLIALLSRLAPSDPVDAYRHGVTLVIAFMAGAGVVSGVLLTARPAAVADRPAPTPVQPSVSRTLADPGPSGPSASSPSASSPSASSPSASSPSASSPSASRESTH
jgi:hypothetical protein